jgi:hypothetical protein
MKAIKSNLIILFCFVMFGIIGFVVVENYLLRTKIANLIEENQNLRDYDEKLKKENFELIVFNSELEEKLANNKRITFAIVKPFVNDKDKEKILKYLLFESKRPKLELSILLVESGLRNVISDTQDYGYFQINIQNILKFRRNKIIEVADENDFMKKIDEQIKAFAFYMDYVYTHRFYEEIEDDEEKIKYVLLKYNTGHYYKNSPAGLKYVSLVKKKLAKIKNFNI